MKKQLFKCGLVGICLVLTLLISTHSVIAQTSSQDKKEAKQAKKEQKAKEAQEYTDQLLMLFDEQKFVLEAHTLFDRSGLSYVLNSTINFVGFDGEYSTVQLGFDQLIGWNGVGGITLDGTIVKMTSTRNNNGAGFTANASIRPKTGGMTTMIFRVSSDGNARVDMSGVFGDKITFQGTIYSLEETKVYKGTPRF